MTAPHPVSHTPILECGGCGHGWHALACDTYVATGGVALKCSCPNSAPNVPTAAEYLAGHRNPQAGVATVHEVTTRVHNHAPWAPMCNERRLPSGQLRGACLHDDGTSR